MEQAIMSLTNRFWKLLESICENIEKVCITKTMDFEEDGKSYDCFVLTSNSLDIVKIIDSDTMPFPPKIIHQSSREHLGERFIQRFFKDKTIVMKEPSIIEKAPAFYKELGIPIARWMWPSKAYKARLILVPRKYEKAVLYIYVLNDQHVIAYRDEALTSELGRFRLEHFEKIKELSIEKPPAYSWVMLRPVTIDMLLDAPKHVDNEPKVVEESPKEPVYAPIEPDNEPLTIEARQEESKDESVKVQIGPADPSAKYEQLELALF